MHEQEERAQPQWLYSAVDAKGRPTQGFVRAASVPLAIEVLARTRPDLRQVNVRTSGMTVGIEGATIEAVGAAGSPARLARLARDLIEQQEKPTLATSLVQLVRSSAWWIGGCVLALGVGIWRDWSLWWLTAIGNSPAFLWTLPANDRAIGFYRRHGFAMDGTSRISDHLTAGRDGVQPPTEIRLVRLA